MYVYHCSSANTCLVHRPRGRPPGSKNKKTILKEAGIDPLALEGMQDHPLLAPPPVKKRGRPPGSKNKKTIEAMQLKAESIMEPVSQSPAQVPEEAVSVAAAASGILEVTPSMPAICSIYLSPLCLCIKLTVHLLKQVDRLPITPQL